VAGAALGALAVALALALGVTRGALAPPAGRWWCVVLDVGQGEAVALGSGGRWWLVDAGGRSPRRDRARTAAVLPLGGCAFARGGVRDARRRRPHRGPGRASARDSSARTVRSVERARRDRTSARFKLAPLARGVSLPLARGPGPVAAARPADVAIAARGDNAASLELGRHTLCPRI
jgi:hypothetical protein